MSPDPTVPAGPPPQVRLAGALVAVQALLALGFAGVLVLRVSSAELPVSFVLGEAAYFAVIGAALLAVGVGLVSGRRWARTPAIVTQLLLLPVVYSLLGPSRQLLLGAVAGAYVVTTFLLLISERSRTWSMGLDLPDAPR
ncbi:MAG: Integral membrane protein [uncultured Pseudonocardia sp.]|uniref:Integral membrane protein n=1 Tax=uncultured Pseudonocardia sp. TaxID=211455 RepID=A0A6J4P9V2_9PSEU|nr:MAG: Integral membrane protein [uncultured Pseudonocardia sp.]